MTASFKLSKDVSSLDGPVNTLPSLVKWQGYVNLASKYCSCTSLKCRWRTLSLLTQKRKTWRRVSPEHLTFHFQIYWSNDNTVLQAPGTAATAVHL